MEKLKHQLAEAEVELELRKKPQVDASPKVVGQGLVIDEWVSYCIFLAVRIQWIYDIYALRKC